VVQRFAKERGSLKPPPPGHVKGYRRLLHGAPDRSVIIAMTGTATSISELLLSAADDVSPYSGAELVVSKVKALVWEAGRFPQSQTPEYNIQTDIGAARSLIERWPSSVPVIWACNNIGDVVYSGPPASVDPMISPYRYAYDLYTGKQNGKRQAWGQIACYWAALGISQGQTELFERATKLLGYGGTRGFVQIDETGNNYWLFNPGNNCYMVRTAAADVLADELNKLLAISTGEQQKDSGQLCTRG
jgi:hypothetical protein